MNQIRVSLFGKLSIQHGDDQRAPIEAIKAQELLCFLLLHPGRPQARELLANTLWADQPEERGRQYLRKALWQLQSSLDGGRSEPLLLVAQGEIVINGHADIWTDASLFETAFHAAKGVQGRHLAPAQAEQLHAAVALYRGELLEGWYQEWCIIERERYEIMYLTTLDKLMGYCETRREFERGIEHGLRILGRDRAREHTHRALMRLYYLAGDRTTAIRQFQRCVTALREELDVAPSSQTMALSDRIRSGSNGAPPLAETEEAEARTPDGGLQGLVGHLQQIESAIHTVRVQLTRKIDPRDPAQRR